MTLIELRKSKKLSQEEAAIIVGMSRRGYQELEKRNDNSKNNYKYVYSLISEYFKVDEEHGLLSQKEIADCVDGIFDKTDATYVILFGSYARNEATEKSDVDLLTDCTITGLDAFGLIEELRDKLHKKVDLVFTRQLKGADELVLDILRDGIKIYQAKQGR